MDIVIIIVSNGDFFAKKIQNDSYDKTILMVRKFKWQKRIIHTPKNHNFINVKS